MRNAAAWGIKGVAPETLSFDWAAAITRAEGIVQKLERNIASLLKKHGVERIEGEATIKAADMVEVDGRLLQAKAILIATGSRFDTSGLPLPAERVWTPKDLLRQTSLPGTLAVLGQGGAAVELAQLLRLTGHEVALLCPDDRLLPEMDPLLEAALAERLRGDGVRLEISSPIEGYDGDHVIVAGHHIRAGAVIVATKRVGVLPKSDVSLGAENGFLWTDANLETKVAGIYAAGDVTGRSSLAHAASAQGLYVVNRLKGHRAPISLERYPRNVYAMPEAAQIGLTEPELKSRGIAYKASFFPLSANGKALAEGQTDGFVRILAAPGTGEVLGAQIIADQASDMIAEAAVMMRMEGTIFDLAQTVHAHPTVSEVFLEASLAAVEWPL
jgi:dihydrolipoamide dehydrogenase